LQRLQRTVYDLFRGVLKIGQQATLNHVSSSKRKVSMKQENLVWSKVKPTTPVKTAESKSSTNGYAEKLMYNAEKPQSWLSDVRLKKSSVKNQNYIKKKMVYCLLSLVTMPIQPHLTCAFSKHRSCSTSKHYGFKRLLPIFR